MASKDGFELPGGRIIRLSGIDVLGLPFEGVMYQGRFISTTIARSQMKADKLKQEEIDQRLSATYWGLILIMRGGGEVPVICTNKTNAEGWFHQIRGLILN